MSLSDRKFASREKRSTSNKHRQQRKQASKWSEIQRGRRQEFSTIKSPGSANELSFMDEHDSFKTEGLTSSDISNAVGTISITCPFDASISCQSNKICPTDNRPCSSSRQYLGVLPRKPSSTRKSRARGGNNHPISSDSPHGKPSDSSPSLPQSSSAYCDLDPSHPLLNQHQHEQSRGVWLDALIAKGRSALRWLQSTIEKMRHK